MSGDPDPAHRSDATTTAMAWGRRAEPLDGRGALRRLVKQATGRQALPRLRSAPIEPYAAAQTDALLRAAGYHLTRVGLLADTEWKVSLAFWASQIASGAALISIAAGNRLDLAYLLYRHCAITLIGYLVAAWAFVFAFSVNQSQSIGTERNRYLFFEGAGLMSAGVNDPRSHCPVKVMPGYTPLDTVPRGQARLSMVWAMKLVSTTAFIAGIWGIALIAAGHRATRPLDLHRLDIVATINVGVSIVIGALWIGLCALFYLRSLRAAR